MKKIYKYTISFLCFTFLIIASNSAIGQTETRVNDLLEFAKKRKAELKLKRDAAKELAKLKGLILRSEDADGGIIDLQYLKNGIPQYFKTDNLGAAQTTRADKLWGAPYNVNGSTYSKLGEWDGGAVRLSHQEFGGRVTQMDTATVISNHSTHVAGTLIASGVDANAKGMAYAGTLKAWEWTDDEAEMATAAAGGLEISNHSYGFVRGWVQLTDYGAGLGNYWFGDKDVSATEDFWFGFYDEETRTIDQVAYDAPNYLIIKSAGNDRGEGPLLPGILTSYWWDNVADDWVAIPGGTTLPENDGGTSGYDCVGVKGVAKNILTVGAVEEVANYTGAGDVVMSSFSGWGPADDGRIKPDVVAKGVSVYSSEGDSDNDYASYDGTSMASPNTAGTLALLQELYQSTHSSQIMKSATLKALVIHTADEAGSADGPDYQFGWGLVNGERAAQVINDDVSLYNTIDELMVSNSNSTYTRNVSVDGSEPLVVTIVWTDEPGTALPYSLDPSTSSLVNDLDLKVTKGGSTYYPWKLDGSNPTAAATNNSQNHVDNVEKVEIASPAAGTYTIEVSITGSLAKTNGTNGGGQQAFALIVSGDNTPLPVELTSLSAHTVDGSVVSVEWETATELNNYGFDVERKNVSENNDVVSKWEKIGFVEGHGNSNSPKYYNYTDNTLSGGNKFMYRLKQIDLDGTFEYSDEIEVEVLPNEYVLEQNFPNPFNPTTSINFSLPKISKAKLVIYDLLGREVATLVNSELPAGLHTVNFDASDLGSGVYIYSLKTEDFSQIKRMLLVK